MDSLLVPFGLEHGDCTLTFDSLTISGCSFWLIAITMFQHGRDEMQGNTVNIVDGCDLSSIPAIDLGTGFVLTGIGCGAQSTCALGENPEDIKVFGSKHLLLDYLAICHF